MFYLENTIKEDIKLYNKLNFVDYLTYKLDANARDKNGQPFVTLFYNGEELSWGTMQEVNQIVKALITVKMIDSEV